mmetsp:Transcript_42442/g.136063  ORF Transcript_42442/g.136063 Transcript_42442/m.136063 type:complete len:336 (+) Transcript_42442:961-1968(+)
MRSLQSRPSSLRSSWPFLSPSKWSNTSRRRALCDLSLACRDRISTSAPAPARARTGDRDERARFSSRRMVISRCMAAMSSSAKLASPLKPWGGWGTGFRTWVHAGCMPGDAIIEQLGTHRLMPGPVRALQLPVLGRHAVEAQLVLPSHCLEVQSALVLPVHVDMLALPPRLHITRGRFLRQAQATGGPAVGTAGRQLGGLGGAPVPGRGHDAELLAQLNDDLLLLEKLAGVGSSHPARAPPAPRRAGLLDNGTLGSLLSAGQLGEELTRAVLFVCQLLLQARVLGESRQEALLVDLRPSLPCGASHHALPFHRLERYMAVCVALASLAHREPATA